MFDPRQVEEGARLVIKNMQPLDTPMKRMFAAVYPAYLVALSKELQTIQTRQEEIDIIEGTMECFASCAHSLFRSVSATYPDADPLMPKVIILNAFTGSFLSHCAAPDEPGDFLIHQIQTPGGSA